MTLFYFRKEDGHDVWSEWGETKESGGILGSLELACCWDKSEDMDEFKSTVGENEIWGEF